MEITSYLLGKKSGGGGDEPTGTIDITSNGIKNVKSYASANVNVQPDLESKSITITENTTTTITPTTGKDGLSSVQVTTNVSGGSDISEYFSENIFLGGTTASGLSRMIKKIPDSTKISGTSANYMFSNCYLTSIPLQLDTSNITSMRNMFSGCTYLQTIPQLNTSTVTNMQNMFQSCPALTDASLDNILLMCINATSYTDTKTLAKLGFGATDYSTSRIQALPHYQDFIDAGWTIGY